MSPKEVKPFMISLRIFYEQSQMNKEKHYVIFKTISTLENIVD